MADDSTSRCAAGQTGLVVGIPEAEPAVRAWRERFDPSAGAGIPAHVTVLFPFLDVGRADARVCSALADALGRQHAFDLRFESCGRFPGVLYLAPEPDTPLRRLTDTIADRWPEAPPYGGKYTEVVPHLTIADGQDDAVLDEIEADLLGRLPITSRVSSVDLMVHDGAKWQERASFALRA
ncbi:2'-5' RNA ligase family protein [Streptomyces gibsoniae]|uniref:2'-5' RNA ligase family protein n=1 Tax=Streptomyces gibsoniae TaxID=3075529 RepID=A0ABU2TVD8_9ACTN|nr:2'-5' RNA ligase family protein [Streptomyces sp. DSM 41699]MDT0464929.1 2'-5' RNA ligase family protein [Streptomyces sp. DSM 41699]